MKNRLSIIISILILILFGISNKCKGITEKHHFHLVSNNFRKLFTGTIDNEYIIQMELSRENNELSGKYFYTLYKKDISIKGKIDEEGKFVINEFSNKDQHTGIFKGRFTSSQEMEGIWSDPAGHKSMPFKLFEIVSPPLINNIFKTKTIELNLIYALAEFDEFMRYTENTYLDPLTKEHLFLLSKHGGGRIFGVSSHFYAYEGTPLHMGHLEKPLYFSYVGIRINDMELIKELRIEFSKYHDWDENEDVSIYKRNLDWLFSKAYACGPYFGFAMIGSSKLNLFREVEGIYWYQSEKPIKIGSGAHMMQIYFTANQKEGKLTIQVVNTIFNDEDKIYYQPIITNGTNQTSGFYCHFERGPTIDNRYMAYLGNEEKVFIQLKQNVNNYNLEFSFKNKGRDLVTIDKQSLFKIEDQLAGLQNSSFAEARRFKGFNIQNLNGDLIKEMYIFEIKNQIFGKTIEPDKEITIPFVLSEELRKEAIYYITIHDEEDSSTNKNEKPNRNKLIYWNLGEDPYSYLYGSKDFRYLYLVYINKNGLADIEEIKRNCKSIIPNPNSKGNHLLNLCYGMPSPSNSFIYEKTRPTNEYQWQWNPTLKEASHEQGDFCWGVVTPESELESYIKPFTRWYGLMRSYLSKDEEKDYFGNQIRIYHRDKSVGYAVIRSIDKKQLPYKKLGIIYEVPKEWAENKKLSQYILWMIKANPIMH